MGLSEYMVSLKSQRFDIPKFDEIWWIKFDQTHQKHPQIYGFPKWWFPEMGVPPDHPFLQDYPI